MLLLPGRHHAPMRIELNQHVGSMRHVIQHVAGDPFIMLNEPGQGCVIHAPPDRA